jgi:hypothetical protein
MDAFASRLAPKVFTGVESALALKFRSWSRLNDRRKTNVGASLLAKALHQSLIAFTERTLSRAGSLPQFLPVLNQPWR